VSSQEFRRIHRRKTRQVRVGSVLVGGDAPISVQSMTNTLTTDVEGTLEQIRSMVNVGVDIVRVSCPDEASTQALPNIVKSCGVPVIADIHFHYKRAIEAAKAGAACLRINPGNIGSEARVREVIQAAKDYGCSMRIGVNAGSLDKHLLDKYGEPCPEAMVESALEHAKILEDNDFQEFKISVKASDVFMSMAAYEQLSKVCDYPLHLGITEAGGLRAGTVKSALGIGWLLKQGIGDTIRVSLSTEPAEEVRVGFDILKSLDLRHRGVRVVACPSCARQGFDVPSVVSQLESRLEHIVMPISLSVLGCVVNGPGEAKSTDIGLTGGGKGKHKVFLCGVPDHTIGTDAIVDHLVNLVEKRVQALTEAEQKL